MRKITEKKRRRRISHKITNNGVPVYELLIDYHTPAQDHKVEFKLGRSKTYENLKDRCVKLAGWRDIYIAN